MEIGLVRQVLGKKAWLDISDKNIMLKENTDIGRELKDDEVKRQLAACKTSISRHLYPAVLTSIHTGPRKQELRLLRRRQVDLMAGTITVGNKAKTEGSKGRVVYLSALAVQTLQNWRGQFPDAQPSHAVFPWEDYALRCRKGTVGEAVVPYRTFPDQPILNFSTAWGTAKKAAGVECRWRDLRHSAASRIAAGGATDQTLQELL